MWATRGEGAGRGSSDESFAGPSRSMAAVHIQYTIQRLGTKKVYGEHEVLSLKRQVAIADGTVVVISR